jgi:hypothetical protein
MPATNNFEDEILKLLFQNVNISNMGDSTGIISSTTAGSHYISLHTAALSDVSNNQNTSETSYAGYARKAVARSSAQWAISGTTPTQVANINAITFGASTNGPFTMTDFGIGYAASGSTADSLRIYGSLTSNLVINNGITPEFAASSLQITVS